ncbi:hypothetical protein FHS43_005011 [Streptosporangium becharense]|uniref:Aminoglycoside phosphotransferase domain-containing protein n=1 Tax=Streptosporangium becharense TaxID=1816182 RepID=A0A7W9MEZ9_9ACTN|nr:aminoglycoside phosphotransferase family protein [Streptosporangium becharense]MBB2913702.1 hypothetical protein [Streptosporangium becharense]MBB5817783.1 hypothetical protein [Streptosporangium becharense]
MNETADRTVSALVTMGTEFLGTVGPFPVDVPWWPEAGPVVAHLEEVLRVPVAVLRLVDVRGGGHGGPRGGHTTYHVEALRRPEPLPGALRPAGDGSLDGDGGTAGSVVAALREPAAHRAAWATAEGVREALAWADDALRAAGRPATGPVRQVKTWNLAALFRVPTGPGPVWMKITPEFAVDEAHVAGILAAEDPDLVPAVVAADPRNRRVLLEHVPGDDCWDAPDEVVREAVSRLTAAQAAVARRWAGGKPDGLPDRTPPVLAALAHELLDGETGRDLSAEELSLARGMADRLPSLVASLEECGLPYTLTHGDFHPGNWRSDGRRTVVLDLADAHYGHPAVDGLRPRDYLPADRWERAAAVWCESWSTRVPGCDPARALTLAEPLRHLASAIRYQEFLDNIEADERRYHEGDPAHAVRAALAATAGPH